MEGEEEEAEEEEARVPEKMRYLAVMDVAPSRMVSRLVTAKWICFWRSRGRSPHPKAPETLLQYGAASRGTAPGYVVPPPYPLYSRSRRGLVSFPGCIRFLSLALSFSPLPSWRRLLRSH